MYKLNVKNLLDAKGKTQYWLAKQEYLQIM